MQAVTRVSVLLGNGNGTFQAQQTFATGFDHIAMAVGDVNGDGKPDIVVANGIQQRGKRRAGQRQWDLPVASRLSPLVMMPGSVAVGRCEWRRQTRPCRGQ